MQPWKWVGKPLVICMRHVFITLILLLTSAEVSQAGTACDAVEGFDYRGAKIKKIPMSPAYFTRSLRWPLMQTERLMRIIPWIKESMHWRMLAFQREIGKRFWWKIQRNPMNP